MVAFRPPIDALLLAMETVGLDGVLDLPAFEAYDRSDVEEVTSGFGRFAAGVIAPTDSIGDAEGASYSRSDGRVIVPEPIRLAYQRWVADGWGGLSMPPAVGGGGLPAIVGVAAEEMFASANMALSLNPMLSQGAVHLLVAWGSEDQKALYLRKLVSGVWSGTMNLTEPDAGSDVGAVRTEATPRSDGRWAITGSKIFITWGEHDATENIIHLVLARTPGAPTGSRGLSLFVVPRNHIDADGTIGARNDVRCTGLERKLGIHASPTCTLDFDGAIGDLVGPQHGGMTAMFTMMNSARLSVGTEGVAVAERAYQQALAHASERRQGRVASTPVGGTALIIEHPDVRRMLLLMASGIDAMRLLVLATASVTDRARHDPDPERRTAAQRRVDLLTPLAKAWSTDEGVRLASIAIQVCGGMGFIEETGVAQHFRDSRIAPIYEGTNGIQAIDLVQRKVVRDNGETLKALLADVACDVHRLEVVPGTEGAAALFELALRSVEEATTALLGFDDADRLAAATPFLDLASMAVCGGLLARQARWAHEHRTPEVARAVAGRMAFFAVERVASAPALLAAISAGVERLHRSYLPDTNAS